ncbi:LOW QUALITY PROTEIN: syntaxin-19 [Sarcophilus harrisii]
MSFHSIIYEKEPTAKRLHDIQRLQELSSLTDSIQKFGEQKRLVASMKGFSHKKESSHKKKIKTAERNNKNLSLLKEMKKSEAQNGPSSLTRIHKSNSLPYSDNSKILCLYITYNSNKAEKMKKFIFHQFSQNVSREVNDMLQPGKSVFNENLLTEINITKVQLSEVEKRHKFSNLENQVKDLKGQRRGYWENS